MINLIFMVYLYHRFTFGSLLFKPTCSYLALVWSCSRINQTDPNIPRYTQYYVHDTHMDVVTSSGLDSHVGGSSSAGRKFEDIWRVPRQHCILIAKDAFIYSLCTHRPCPQLLWTTAITSSKPSIFFLRIVDRSAAGPAFGAFHSCSRFRLSTSPHLPLLFCRFYSSKKKKSNKMPPKKQQVQEKVLLGRPGNNLKSGIVCELGPHPFFFFFSFFHTAQSTFTSEKLFKPPCPPSLPPFFFLFLNHD